ncbi:MAG: DUF4139 domain-containing protein [Armatimonadetes bacterium]|nr:DUF4139 domain-containing protein [Armatimonadota bacterium]
MKSIAPFLLLVVCASSVAQTVSGPKSIQLTVYNQNFALVKDLRSVNLTKGVNSIEVEDVAAKIDPTSVLFRSITAPNSVVILEQNYQYDLISPENILNKSVGERLTFTRFNDQGLPVSDSGILVNPPKNGGTVIKTDDGKLVLNPVGQISLQKMPEGLHPKPTLNWLLECDRAGEQQAEISYMTDGIEWRADYVALVNKDDSALDLSGWVTLNNQSGATYENAKLTLMAGDVRRKQEEYAYDRSWIVTKSMAEAARPQFEEKAFFEYHMYTMERPTTIRDSETKQLSLLTASNVPVKKEMIYDGRGNWWRSWWYPGRTGDPGGGYDTSDYHKVNVVLEVKNSKENHMGMPLPKGKVRVYKLDDTGSQQFVGEDTIDHTPKDEKLRLYVGDAFDVVGDYKRTDYAKISERVIEESFEVKIRNHKQTPVEVKVVDHVWSDWKVVKSSHDYTKKDAHTIEFPVKVPKDGEVVVRYTIRTAW